jgi:hypothetical protein
MTPNLILGSPRAPIRRTFPLDGSTTTELSFTYKEATDLGAGIMTPTMSAAFTKLRCFLKKLEENIDCRPIPQVPTKIRAQGYGLDPHADLNRNP